MVDVVKSPKDKVKVAVVGKYVDLQDSYISVKEALVHAGLHYERDIEFEWIPAEDVEENGAEVLLGSAEGIVVPGGFGPRGVEGMIATVNYAREQSIPYLGLCLGLQVMVVEIARSLLGKSNANSTEFDPSTPDPVIDLMENQRSIESMGGTMRLGIYPCKLIEGSLAQKVYGEARVNERHRHRFEFNNKYRELMQSVDLWASGISPDDQLVEIMELRDHPFMMGVQFHPEFLSRPDRPHPLFREFIASATRIVREGGQHMMPLEVA
jgi:CTP synthase